MADFSELDFLTNPDDAQARAMMEARMQALRRGRAQRLALLGAPGSERIGQALLGQEQHAYDQLGDAVGGRLAQQRHTQEMGLRQSENARQEAELGLNRQRVAQGWAGLNQARYSAMKVKDAYGNEQGVLFDSRTGKFLPLPAGFGGSGAPGAGPVKMNEGQMKMSGNIGSASAALDTALRVGFPKPGFSGIGQNLGQLASKAGFPALASPEAEQTYAAWYNILSPVVHARTGQQMSVQELEREFASLVPRPGESPYTMLMKTRQMVPTLRKYTVGLPPGVRADIEADLSNAEQLMPRSVEDIMRMQATGKGGEQPQPPPARAAPQAPAAPTAPSATDVRGRRIIYR